MTNPLIVQTYLRHLLDQTYGQNLTVQDNLYIVPLPPAPELTVVPGPGYALRVRATALVAHDVAPTTDLLVALNSINVDLAYGRILLVDDTILVEHSVVGEELTPAVLDNAIQFVSWAVRTFGPDLVERFGGHTPIQPQLTLPLTDSSPQATSFAQPAQLVGVAGDQGLAAAHEPVGRAAGYL